LFKKFYYSYLLGLIFFALFKLSVNKIIDNKAALISSFITLTTLSITKNLFIYYVVYNKTYTTIYGSLSTLLFTFLWIYISWIIYLYGIKICHKLNMKYLKNSMSWQRPTFPQGDPAVLSAMKCLTTRFGMGLGISTSL
jgi:membrane protein